MAQKTFTSGEVLTASDVNTYLMGEGGAWTTWSAPTLGQNGTVASSNTRSRYARWGRLIVASFKVVATASGSAGATISISLPVTAASTDGIFGFGYFIDAGTAYYSGTLSGLTTTTAQLFAHNETSAVGATPSITVASGDTFAGTLVFEAAS